MKIAQIAPLTESVPPTLYGGTERIVSFLTEELVRQGHEVVLFASGDSETTAELVPGSSAALRLSNVRDPMPLQVLQLETVRQRAHEFDVLHFHTDFLHFPLVRALGGPCALNTMHGRLDLPGYCQLFTEFDEIPLVAISDHQRLPLPARWMATIYHGLPADLYTGSSNAGGYLAFLGRLCPEKRPDRAIEIARRAGVELKIAAKVDPVDQVYFDTQIRPLLDDPLVDYIGEIGDHEKQAFLSGARALLCPIDWPEPFGLVLIESMACGTPVIAWPHGSVPEVIDHGVSGFIVDRIDDAVTAVDRVGTLDRRAVRARFDERFTADRMAREYVRVYEGLVAERSLDFSLLRPPLRNGKAVPDVGEVRLG